ncbi:RHS repeat-associated core domain-containing protein [Apibacter adventoris]|uniref:RHS repeat-associated core domain-containing protein n=1 Tax=Apibacter adventoris TaxID=1679466 RepID=UPI002936FD11|nr:RHS repeat-associated core domain-containing protein [Apibacter adventoris]
MYGKVKEDTFNNCFSIPFRYQGQYEDEETGLYYNRFRYYDSNSGTYISQDPIGLDGDLFNLYSYVVDTNDGIDPLGLYNPYGNKKNGQFKKKPGPKPKPKPSLHGNSALSTKPAVLYALYDADGNFKKWGITDKVNNPRARYGNTIPEDWDIIEMTRGTRADMLKLERELSEKAPGPLNKEKWAGSKQGEQLSSDADSVNNKMKAKHKH